MSCLTVEVERKGWISSSVERLGDFTTSVSRSGLFSSSLSLLKDFTAGMTREGGLHCRMFQSCATNLNTLYLEIEPTIVWVLAGHTSNDVYSNTTWNID